MCSSILKDTVTKILRKSKENLTRDSTTLIIGDRGFEVHDIVEAKQAFLNIPPFMKGRDRLSSSEEMETKILAKIRIHVEHVMGRIKQFRLLQKTLPLTLRPLLTQIIFVCACLVNFQEPIVFDSET